MKSIKVHYKIGDQSIELNLEGKTIKGNDVVLLEGDTNLLDNLEWEQKGYSVDQFLSEELYSKIVSGIGDLVKSLVKEVGGSVDDNFSMENYHNYVDDKLHLEIAKILKPGFDVSQFPIDFNVLNKRVSEIIQKEVYGEAKHLGVYHFHLRIIRPQKFQDNNPPHRDVWLDRLRNAVNIYVPICGSGTNSSLPLIEGSHLAMESEIERTEDGALLNGTKYTVPCVISYKNQSPKMIRPDVYDNQIMVFSPYLVHGGGYNFQGNKTRISLEARFWK